MPSYENDVRFRDSGRAWPAPSCQDQDWLAQGPVDISRNIRLGLLDELSPRDAEDPYARYWELLARAFVMFDWLRDFEIPLLLAEGRVRYSLRWADLAYIAQSRPGADERSPQALHKRFSAKVNQLDHAAEAISQSGGDAADFYDAGGF
jgi:hypothetical protein